MRMTKPEFAPFRQWLSRCRTIPIMAIIILLTACGGSSDGGETTPGDENNPAQKSAELYINLTDAEGDFLAYSVDVTSISLTRENGQTVEVLPLQTRVDFAQYVDVSELLTLATAPAGRYREIQLQLDFTNAEVIVQDENGNPLAAELTDQAGLAITQTTVAMQLSDGEEWLLVPGIPAIVTLDFDLDASNTITIDQNQAVVVVEPVLVADLMRDDPATGPRSTRLRGLLESVDVASGAIELDLRPFAVRQRSFGHVTIQTTSETVFEINKTVAEAGQGLILLSDLAPDSAVIAMGYWDREQMKFVANEIFAGSSVPWYEADMLRGVVVARSGDIVQVRGSTIEFAEGDRHFNDSVTVRLTDTTRVVKRGDAAANIDDISVGTVLYATGAVTDIDNFAADFVRISPSHAAGTVVSTSPLSVDLALLNGRRPDQYDFSGTGVTAATDADADYYEIATSTLELTDLELGDPIRVRGYISDFATAPEDFSALSVISGTDMRAHIVVGYGIQGSTTAITQVDNDGIILNLNSAQSRHHLLTVAEPVDLNALPAMPVLYSESQRGLFSLCQRGQVVIYTQFAEFIAALDRIQIEGAAIVKVNATGFYDSVLNTFDANQIRVMIKRTQ